MIVGSFIFLMSVFLIIGILSILQNKHTNSDYLLAGHNLKPWLVALSAVATNNSGYMFTGMIGFTYVAGLSSIWLMIGWVFGDFIASLLIHKRLRKTTEKQKVLTYNGALSTWLGKDYKYLRFIGGVVTIAFLGTYAAAQLNAGSKALHILFGWDYHVGAILGATIVLVYCFVGGIRASIWTDAAQSFVMALAMITLLITSILSLGGVNNFIDSLYNVSDSYMNLFPSNLPFGEIGGPIIFVIGWIFAGFGVIGQPHIMIRFMAMDNPKNMNRVRYYYYAWYLLFFLITIIVGLAARLLIPEVGEFDSELALPKISLKLLHPIAVGLILAGLFAATMSTADSQILSCSGALTRDLTFGKNQPYLITKLGTIIVTAISLFIAIYGHDSVFKLVLIAWSALASAFAPLLIVYCLGGKPSEKIAILMLIVGISTTVLWRYYGLDEYFYEVLPGMLSGVFVFVLSEVILKLQRVISKKLICTNKSF